MRRIRGRCAASACQDDRVAGDGRLVLVRLGSHEHNDGSQASHRIGPEGNNARTCCRAELLIEHRQKIPGYIFLLLVMARFGFREHKLA